MTTTDELSLYKHLNDLHNRALSASVALAWNELAVIQEEINTSIAQLRVLPNSLSNGSINQQKAALIRQIIETQKLIRKEIFDWQEDVGFLLGKLRRTEEQEPTSSAN